MGEQAHSVPGKLLTVSIVHQTLTNFSSLCEDEVWHLSLCLYFRLFLWNLVSTLDRIPIPKTTIATIKGEFQSVHKATVSLFQTEFVYFRYSYNLTWKWSM